VITVYKSKKILAMDDNYPDATHVAVRNGFIIAISATYRYDKTITHSHMRGLWVVVIHCKDFL